MIIIKVKKHEQILLGIEFFPAPICMPPVSGAVVKVFGAFIFIDFRVIQTMDLQTSQMHPDRPLRIAESIPGENYIHSLDLPWALSF